MKDNCHFKYKFDVKVPDYISWHLLVQGYHINFWYLQFRQVRDKLKNM